MIIVSPWRGRRGYVRIMLATLKEAMRGHDDVKVWMFDNDPGPYSPLEIFDDFGKQLKSFRIRSRPNTVSHACHFVYIDMLNEVFRQVDDRFVINIDSDCCIHPEFITVAKKMIEDLPDIGHASLYSEGNHPEPTEVVKDIYHRRSHISLTASIINGDAWACFPKPDTGDEMRAFWSEHIEAKEHAGGIDGAFSSWCNELPDFGCYSTINSYVEHIGATGQYALMTQDGSSTAHRARRFLP